MTDIGIAENVLIVSDSDKNVKLFTEMAGLCKTLDFAQSTKAALKVSADRRPNLILIDLSCENILKEVRDIYDSTDCNILLLTKRELYRQISKKLPQDRITVLTKPVSSHTLQQVIKIILKDGIKAGCAKIEEIRLVTHAKCILMEYLQMSENQAHKYIERQAMDMRVTRREIAENILKTYES